MDASVFLTIGFIIDILVMVEKIHFPRMYVYILIATMLLFVFNFTQIKI